MRGGIGLGGILIIGGVLYFTGVGSWIWRGVSQLDQSCYGLLSEIGTSIGTPVCAAVGRGIENLGEAGEDVEGHVSDWWHGLWSRGGIDGLGNDLRDRLSRFTSSSDTLSQMMEHGAHLHIGKDLGEQFQQAIDSFSIGQHYLDNGSTAQAMPWLEQGAAQPGGYGLFSQLQLGNLYGSGGDGVTPNPELAAQSYEQAQQSLQQLMASNTPEAQQMLQSMQQSPEELKQQINQALSQLRVRMHK